MATLRYLICALFLYAFPSFAQKRQQMESAEYMLKTLDYTIQHRKEYDALKEKSIQKLKESILFAGNDSILYTLYNQLFHAYYNHQTDSAMHYVNLELQLVSKVNRNVLNEIRMNQAQLFSTMGMYKEAIEALDSIDRETLTAQENGRYLLLYSNIYYLVAGYSLTDQEQVKYYKIGESYRDTLLSLYPKENDIYLRTLAIRLIQRKQYDEAIEVLDRVPASQLQGHLEGLVAFDKASAYEGMQNIDREIYYLAKSAIVDLKMSIKEYVSLHKLAILLFNKGDIERAYIYLNCSMEDAIFCNARFRTISITQTYPIIDKAYRMKSESAQRLQRMLTWIISILSFFLFVTLIYLYKQMNKLRIARKETNDINQQLKEVNERLYEVNHELSTSNIVRQEYLVHYLEQCSMYLDKMENYRRSLENYAITSDMKGLFKAIKSETHISEEREKFYKSFDETFLNLFPSFVESFNQLLRDDEQICPKGEDLLSPELRIFALIRLGINDSNKIAKFLRYSLITIYNYRSKVRNKAKNKKNFEDQVRMVCK